MSGKKKIGTTPTIAAFHPRTTSIAATTQGSTTLTATLHSHTHLVEDLPSIFFLRFAPTELLLLVASDTGKMALLAQPIDSGPLVCVARLHYNSSAMRALEWMPASMASHGIQAFVAVREDRSIAVHWRHSFGAAAMDAAAALAFEVSTPTAQSFGWSLLHGVLPASDASVGLAAVTAVSSSKGPTVLVATTGPAPSREVTVWCIVLPHLAHSRSPPLASTAATLAPTVVATLALAERASHVSFVPMCAEDTAPHLLVLTGIGAERWRCAPMAGGGSDVAGAAWECVRRDELSCFGSAHATGVSSSYDGRRTLVSLSDETLVTLEREAASVTRVLALPLRQLHDAGTLPPSAKRARRAMENGVARGTLCLSPNGMLGAAVDAHGDAGDDGSGAVGGVATTRPRLRLYTLMAEGDAPRDTAPTALMTHRFDETFVEDASRCLLVRVAFPPLRTHAPPPAHPWDVLAVLAALPRARALAAARAIAGRLESRLSEMWHQTKATPKAANAAAATAQRLRVLAQIDVEGPRTCALLATLWGAAADATRAAADGSAADGTRVATAWRSHAALWVACQVVSEELDRHGAAGEETATPAPAATSNGTGGVVAGGGTDGGGPQWNEVMKHLSGTARLSTMSERRLAELHAPCQQLLLLLLGWMDTTRQAHAHAHIGGAPDATDALAADGGDLSGDLNDGGAGGGATARTMRLLACPPPLVDALLPRITAVLLAAHTRLGHVSGGGGGGALVGLWSMETLQQLFSAYRLRRGGGSGATAMGSARGGGLGSEVAWGVVSVCEQYGLGGGGGGGDAATDASVGSVALAMLQQPASQRAFEALMRWAGVGANP